MAKLNAILESILPIFLHLGGDPWRNGRSVKTTNTPTLLVVFWGLGPPPEGPGGCLGRVFGAMLEDVGSKMVFFGISWEIFGSYVGRCWLQNGVFLVASLCQDGAQERQDETR